MAKRYCGDLEIDIKFLGTHGDNYKVSVCKRNDQRECYTTRELRAPGGGFQFAYDSPEAYDEMSQAAVGFAGYDEGEDDYYEPTRNYSTVLNGRRVRARTVEEARDVASELNEAALGCMGEDDYEPTRARGAAPGPRKRGQKPILGRVRRR